MKPQQFVMHQNFKNNCNTYHSKAFLYSANGVITYGEFYSAVVNLQNMLGVLDQTPIAIMLDKSIEQIIAIVGVVVANKPYLPLDPSWPLERIKSILKKANVTRMITNAEFNDKARSLDVDIINITNIKNDDKKLIEYDVNSNDLAYILFTSGSTGIPKGVAIEHGAVYNSIDYLNTEFNLNNNEILLSLSSYTFDLSVYDIFGMLDVGGSIVLPENEEKLEPKNWVSYLEKYNVTVWNSVPAFAQMLVDYIDVLGDNGNTLKFESMKLVILGGDWIPVTLPAKLKNIFPNAEVVSVGGSTETSIWGCMYKIDTNYNYTTKIPYGRAIRTQTMQIMDDKFNLLPVGAVGEIIFGGGGLARGYFNDDELTAEKFVTSPITGERLYKSGDLGKLMPDGNIEFVARIDDQLQVNGLRVEPAEIEAAILQHPAVEKVVVIGIDTSNKSKQLAAAIIAKTPDLDTAEVRKFIASIVPEHFIPQIMMIIKEFPMSANGKIDRKQIAQIFHNANTDIGKIKTTCKNEQEEIVLAIWKKIFNNDEIDVVTDFFACGGTSVIAVKIITNINTKMQSMLAVSTLFQHRNVRDLVAYMNMNNDLSQHHLPKLMNNVTNGRAIFLIHPIGGNIFCYYQLAELINMPVYGIEYPFELGKSTNWEDLDDLARLYAIEIMKCQHNNLPYTIGGWSSGGTIAYLTGVWLKKMGQQVEQIIMLDTTCPNTYRENLDNSRVNELAFNYYVHEINKYLDRKITPQHLLHINFEHSLPILIAQINEELDVLTLCPPEAKLGLSRTIKVFSDVLDLVVNHEIKDYANKIVFLRADTSKSDLAMGWQKYSRSPILEYTVPGNHLSIVDDMASCVHMATIINNLSI